MEVVWVVPATWVVAEKAVPVARAPPTTSQVVAAEVVNHRMAEPVVSLKLALLPVAMPVVRGLS